MKFDPGFYLNRMYPLQDIVLRHVSDLETGFYLTGGTALSRGYLQHRFSEDLDFFVNDNPLFSRWGGRIIQTLTQQNEWGCTVNQRDDYFIRLSLQQDDLLLKIELVNDVPAHVGDIQQHPVLGRLDSVENIFANKLTAVLGRSDAKDLADIWAITKKLSLSISQAITDAQSKAAGIFPVALARELLKVTLVDWEQILWQEPPPADQFMNDLKALGESLIFGEA
jgi:predicted nucleotidyltransferase component of viral defense system